MTVEAMLPGLRRGGLWETSVHGDMAQCPHVREVPNPHMAKASWCRGFDTAWVGGTVSIPPWEPSLPLRPKRGRGRSTACPCAHCPEGLKPPLSPQQSQGQCENSSHVPKAPRGCTESPGHWVGAVECRQVPLGKQGGRRIPSRAWAGFHLPAPQRMFRCHSAAPLAPTSLSLTR